MSDAITSSHAAAVAPPSAATPTAEVVEPIALDSLRPSSTKVQAERRARFDAKALKDLTETVREVGVLEPILVRLIKSDPPAIYEIVAGERRWCAARGAGLATIPAIVRELTDVQVLRLQLIENIQREDIHPLDQAVAFETLLKDHTYTVQRIASEIRKPRKHVIEHLQLLALCPAAREAFGKGKLVFETAFMLARVPTEELQRQALKEITARDEGGEPMTPRQVARHLQQRYMLRLADASFPTQDAELLPEAGPCGACPKRTGNQPELFKDVQGADVCIDPPCFRAKREAWTARQIATAKAAGRTVIDGEEAMKIAEYGAHHLEGHVKPTDRCYDDKKQRTYRELIGESLEPALLVVPTTGDVIEVIDRKKLAPLLKDRGIGTDAPKGNDSDRERRAKVKRESAFRWKLFEAVRAKSPTELTRTELEEIAVTAFRHHGYESRKRLLKAWGWFAKNGKELDSHYHEKAAAERLPKLSDAELTKFLLDCVFVSDLAVSAWNPNDKPDRLLAAAKRLRIDVDAIRTSSAESGGKLPLKAKHTSVKPKPARTNGRRRTPKAA